MKRVVILALGAGLMLGGNLSAQGRYETVHTFSGDRGTPVGGLVEGPDGRLYGTTISGGFFGKGTIFATDALGNATTLHEFNGADGAAPRARLLLASDGNFYGTTSRGGSADHGALFRITPDGDLTALVAFNFDNGSQPESELLQTADGTIYGTTTGGGPSAAGTMFRLSGGTFATIVSFDGINGNVPSGALTADADGNIYGTTKFGGANALGSIFQLAPDGTLTTLASFDSANGAVPADGIVKASDGNFYGTTLQGGPADAGTVFRLAADGTLTTVVAFTIGNGALPSGGLRQFSDGLLYGTTEQGGNGFGTIFRLDPVEGTFTTLISFAGADGTAPASGLFQTPGGSAYGTTKNGGPTGFGTVFRLTPDLALTTVVGFAGSPNGAIPSGRLLQAGDGNFYGTTLGGGAHGCGTVFRLTPDRFLTTMASFNRTDGAFPSGGLVQGNDGNLYGTTEEGGPTNDGTIFRMTLDGTLESLVSFDSSMSGGLPLGGLIRASDGNLYGTTLFGRDFSVGSVFRVTLAGGLTTLVDFDGTNGTFPTGVVEADGAFYGTTQEGGENGFGTVFRLGTDGTLSTLLSFSDVDGAFPVAPLLRASDGSLYGTTTAGGDTGDGTVFQVMADGTVHTIASFDGINGSFPQMQGLVEGPDGHVYGTAMIGGEAGFGTVYRVDAAAIVAIHSLTGITGANPNATLMAASDGTLYGSTEGPQGGTVFRILLENAVASLEVAPARATFGAVTTFSATLTRSAAPVVGAEIVFSLNGVAAGAAMTDGSGIATLAGVSVAGLDAGSYAGAVTASFAGDGTPVVAAADLTIAKATPAVSISGGTFFYDAQPHPATAAAAGVDGQRLSPVVITYNGSSSAPVEPGTYVAVASYGGSTNYEAASASAGITIRPPAPGVDGLIAAYGFNEGGGNIAADASGKGHAGTISGARYIPGGRFGGALSFDGVNDWVTVADKADLDFTTAITIEAWVNPRALYGWNTIALKETKDSLAYALYANDNDPRPAGYVNIAGEHERVHGEGPLPLNGWTHVAVTYNGSVMRLYINGLETNYESITGRIVTSNAPLRIGGNSIWEEFFNGTIDELRIYGVALDVSSIRRDMNLPIAHESEPPVVSIVSPLNAAVLSGMPVISVSATDNVAVASVQLELDGKLVGSSLAAAPFTFRLNAANGSHAVRAVARDTAGNVTFSDPIRITIANRAVADYRFNEADGTAVLDGSGRGNNGRISSGVTRATDSVRGRVLSFNGSSGMVSVPDSASLDLTTGMTLEAWVKPTALSGWRTVILKEADDQALTYALYANDNAPWPAGYVQIDGVDQSVHGTRQLSIGVWTHLAMTHDGSTMRIYVNGVEKESRPQTGSAEVSNGQLRIGGNAVWGEWFKGQIDDARIYDVAVSPAQIQADMSGQ